MAKNKKTPVILFRLPLPIMLDELRTLPQYLVPQVLLSWFCGRLADNTLFYRPFIKWFVNHFNVDMREALHEDINHYTSFNDFFTRHLKENIRPIDNDDKAIISPCDGVISQIGQASVGTLIQAKGRNYAVTSLLGDEREAQTFSNGLAMTLYLSPKDYHRIHFPLDAEVQKMVYIPGKLFAVKPLTARTVPNLFARNERLIIYLNTPIGRLAYIMVGAMIVGSIGVSWHGDITRCNQIKTWDYQKEPVKTYQKGDELGYFKLGSTIVLLFENKASIAWKENITSPHPIKFGERIGEMIPKE